MSRSFLKYFVVTLIRAVVAGTRCLRHLRKFDIDILCPVNVGQCKKEWAINIIVDYENLQVACLLTDIILSARKTDRLPCNLDLTKQVWRNKNCPPSKLCTVEPTDMYTHTVGNDVSEMSMDVVLHSDECSFPHEQRYDCGFDGITEEECGVRGCCHNSTVNGTIAPHCFYPQAGKSPISDM